MRDEEEGDDFSNQYPIEQQFAEGLSLLTRATAALDSPKPISANSPKLGNASQNTLPLANCPIPRTDSQQKTPTKSLAHYLRRKKSIHSSTLAHTVSPTAHEHDIQMVFQKLDTDKRQSQQVLMSGSHAESGSLSSDSDNET